MKIVLLSFLLAGFLYHISLVGWMRHVTMGGMLGASSSLVHLPASVVFYGANIGSLFNCSVDLKQGLSRLFAYPVPGSRLSG